MDLLFVKRIVRMKVMKKFRKKIELFDVKSDEVVRNITFRNIKDFEKFLDAFTLMRYPGYGWRVFDKKLKN